jgi:hypothetical protein
MKDSIMSPNSLYGAMAIGGMALAFRLRQKWPELELNETHPKVLFGSRPDWCKNILYGSVLADVVRVEHILAVKNDVFPFDGADMLQETDVDIFAFRNAHFQNAGDFLGLPIDDTGQQ